MSEEMINATANTEEKSTPKPNPATPSADPAPAAKEPTIQELLVEVAKLKRNQEKAASEAAEWKKKYNSTLSEKELMDNERAEAQAKRDEEFEQMKRELQINRLEKTYLSMDYTAEEAAKIAVAEADNDFDEKVKIMRAVDARKQKEQEAKWLRDRPQVNTGTEDEAAKDPFLAGLDSVPMRFAKK